jgi:hypothetical protein
MLLEIILFFNQHLDCDDSCGEGGVFFMQFVQLLADAIGAIGTAGGGWEPHADVLAELSHAVQAPTHYGHESCDRDGHDVQARIEAILNA